MPAKYSYSENEKKIIERLTKHEVPMWSGVNAGLVGNVEYKVRGNFVIAIVPTKKGIYVGDAKRNPKDAFDLKAGQNIAFKRAIMQDEINKHDGYVSGVQ